ncbi:endoribonuclease YbeY [Bacteroidia bacterium]|nr:endoribonuclease YbeY [Bacteroidia bacterium]
MAIIEYKAIEVEIPPFRRRAMSHWLKKVVVNQQKKLGNLCYIFCSDEEILKLNEKFLNHDYYTDIITFDYSVKDTISGDMFISLDSVRSNAKKYATLENEELRRVMVHGLLHLCGYNDKTPQDIKFMRAQEELCLNLENQVE